MPKKEDLMKMFDLTAKPKAAKASSGGLEFLQEEELNFDLSKPETALLLDAWDMERGVHLHSTQNLSEQVSHYDWADLHGAAFLIDPKLVENPHDKRKHDFLKTLMETSDYKNLHQQTSSNPTMAELAAIKFAEAFSQLREKDTAQKERIALARKLGKPINESREESKATSSLYVAVNEGLKQAGSDVEEFAEACRSMGTDPSCPTKQDGAKIATLFQRVRHSPTLRAIIERAGRWRRSAQSKQRQKVFHGYDDLVGVVMDNDVGRLLPYELVQLMDDDLELNTMRRFVEKQTLCREYRGIEPIGKGPIVMYCDESGSMRGVPNYQSKAFALSMAWVARHQKRYCCLVAYAGPNARGRSLVLKPDKWDERALLDWLEAFMGGGTSMHVPLIETPLELWGQLGVPKGKTDVIILTDGLVDIPVPMREQFIAWKKKENAKCISLVLDGPVGDLAYVSDEAHSIRGVELGEPGIQKCLSI